MRLERLPTRITNAAESRNNANHILHALVVELTAPAHQSWDDVLRHTFPQCFNQLRRCVLALCITVGLCLPVVVGAPAKVTRGNNQERALRGIWVGTGCGPEALDQRVDCKRLWRAHCQLEDALWYKTGCFVRNNQLHAPLIGNRTIDDAHRVRPMGNSISCVKVGANTLLVRVAKSIPKPPRAASFVMLPSTHSLRCRSSVSNCSNRKACILATKRGT
mmetsp:Transcript_71293/g.230636  ORF Transcript_71293/g.230636 Transcript_71293/m.230636 type:complete len:219 (+) Transcript_71293:393-1049(+)